MHQILYILYVWICLKLSKLKWWKHKSFHSFPIIEPLQSFQSIFMSIPLFLSERCGWLLTGLGSPCVAQRVWAIPRCTSNSISKSISCCSEDKMKNSNIKSCCRDNTIFQCNYYSTVYLEYIIIKTEDQAYSK